MCSYSVWLYTILCMPASSFTHLQTPHHWGESGAFGSRDNSLEVLSPFMCCQFLVLILQRFRPECRLKCTVWELWVKLNLGQNADYSQGDSTSDRSEKLLQRGGRWGRSVCYCGGKGGRIHEDQSAGSWLVMREQRSPWRI